MKTNEPHPRWFVLYLFLPLLILLFWLQSRLVVPANDHQWLQLGILFLVYFLVSRWIKANQYALIRLQMRENSGQTRVETAVKPKEPEIEVGDAWITKSNLHIHPH